MIAAGFLFLGGLEIDALVKRLDDTYVPLGEALTELGLDDYDPDRVEDQLLSAKFGQCRRCRRWGELIDSRQCCVGCE